MGYNRENFARIKAEYSNKYLKAREEADARRYELYDKIPELWRIDTQLSSTCIKIMDALGSGKENFTERLDEIRLLNSEYNKKRAELLEAAGYPSDYTDVRYECEACGDTGYVDTKMCSCMKKALAMAGYESSGLGGLIGRQRFDNFSFEYYTAGANRETMKNNAQCLSDFANTIDGSCSDNFLLFGGTGLGKTHLSTAVAERVIDRGYDVVYTTAVGMLGDFEEKRFGNSASGTRGRDTRDYYECDLLIIDDLGTEVVNQFSLSCIYDLLNSRINGKKSTMINTNLGAKDIEGRYGERIASRLFGEYRPLRFVGSDVRRQKLMKK
ncbi:MAG: ATP-binding protein [Clostridia bacterium]|nr:ATP-binding protein [Clostridia bacterium]